MGAILFFLWIILIQVFEGHFWPITGTIFGFYLVLKFIIKIVRKFSLLRHKAREYDKLLSETNLLEEKTQNLEKQEKKFEEYKKEEITSINKLIEEKSSAFPWLAKAFADYNYLKKMKEADYLEHKSHPAHVSAQRVREITRERRIIEEKLRIAQGIINYYQELFPFLEEFFGDIDEEILKKVLSRNIEHPIKDVDEIGIDPIRIYLSSLSEKEYQKLSSIERNQLALDRYWNSPKNNWQLGRDYERYIGYLYEREGYYVYYKGILEGLDDLGRDLVCKKSNQTIIIQCKRWSQYKTIHEKHINQLYGTVIKYIIDNPDEKVGTIFYTTTKLPNRAKEFAKYLSITVAEEFPFLHYSSIKCNKSRRTEEKIYHLLFDQQYDKTVIEEERNEQYVRTVKEAENLGYRRAWRWRGQTPE
jgi:hypothetical protein